MIFAKRHYEEIAASLLVSYNACDTQEQRTVVAIVASRLAEKLKVDNPRFDRDRFIRAATGGR